MKTIRIINNEDERQLHDQWLAAVASNNRGLARELRALIDESYHTASSRGKGWQLIITTNEN